MYTVGLDADTLVSKLEEILIYKIKLLAGNSILNLSPPLLGDFFLFVIYYNIIKREKFVFSKGYTNIKKLYYISTCEVGKI
jgi:hypothetical protein